jgi:prepilin-type N-terminal cleavage/methylation domain-containing protein
MTKNGFTLIEILIVLVIIAIISSVAILSIGAPSYPKFMAEANKASVTFELISDRAVYSNSVIVCGIDHYQPSCQEYKDGQWQEMRISTVAPWIWPQNIKIQKVLVDGALLKSGQTFRFLQMGNLQQLNILITNGQFSAWIDSDFNGGFKIEH